MDRASQRRHGPPGAAWAAALLLSAVAVLIGGCSTQLEDLGSETTDPAKYTFYKCPDLVARSRTVMAREHELRGLMEKAQAEAGGALVSALSYRSEYLSVRGDLNLIRRVAAEQKCQLPDWQSDAVVR